MRRCGAPFLPLTLGRTMVLLWAALSLFPNVRATSLQTFAVVFGQATNEIALIEQQFNDSPAQKEKLAALARARSVILNLDLRDEEALAALVNLLGSHDDYDTTLDESAANARAAVLARYDLLATRVVDLPPSSRTTTAKNRFADLAGDRAALANAAHAAGISSLLAPFGRRVESISEVVVRAQEMPRPNVGLNAVRATVDGRRFSGGGAGRHSPNEFDVTEPGPLYRAVDCRVMDGQAVIRFTLPAVTDRVRYEVAQGLATLTFTPDIFEPVPSMMAATSGTFFVQSDANRFMDCSRARDRASK